MRNGCKVADNGPQLNSEQTMKAAVLYGKEDVRIESVPVPTVARGEVRVRIEAALTCGTDVKVFRRGYHARMIRPPSVFGHEFAGVVESIGEGVDGFAVGDRVVAANSAPCGSCFFCRRERAELCEDLLFINGAYAQYITIPDRLVRTNLVHVPKHVSFEEAAMLEPLACVVHGMRETAVMPGDTVAVIGNGPIGLIFVSLCKLAGATVITVGRNRARLDLARKLGADRCILCESAADISEKVRSETDGGRGADKVIECVGLPEVWEQAVSAARKGGVANLFGGCPRDTTVTVGTSRIHYDEITLKGSFHHTPLDVREALRLIETGDFPARQFIQQSASLEELPDILRSLMNGSSIIKAAIHPQ